MRELVSLLRNTAGYDVRFVRVEFSPSLFPLELVCSMYVYASGIAFVGDEGVLYFLQLYSIVPVLHLLPTCLLRT